MILPITIRHNPEYFNINAQATIPENWQADVIELPTKFGHYRVYGIGDTRTECIHDLVNQLKEMGLSGHLRIVSDDK